MHAVALVHADSVFSHESAAVLLGLPVFGDPLTVHVLVSTAGASRSAGGIRTHRSSSDREIIEIGGFALASPVDTAVDMARYRHPAIGAAAADAVLRLDTDSSVDRLIGVNEGRSSDRGRNLARWPLARATPLAETALESISLTVINWLGLPEPELQVVYVSDDGGEDRADFSWPDFGLLGEADGDLKYDGRFGDALTKLREQRLRDARLRQWMPRIGHWGWTEATQVDPLRLQLLGLGLRQTAPQNTAGLHSLRLALATRPPHLIEPTPRTGHPDRERTTGRRGIG